MNTETEYREHIATVARRIADDESAESDAIYVAVRNSSWRYRYHEVLEFSPGRNAIFEYMPSRKFGNWDDFYCRAARAAMLCDIVGELANSHGWSYVTDGDRWWIVCGQRKFLAEEV